ncbi:MAG: MFS transporter [Peptococcaceae bacterium]|nr:MFS transporter [Peptococcaceae bacterium]
MEKNRNLRWAALTVLFLAYLLSVFHRVTIAMMADRLMADLSLSPTQIGLLAAVYFYPYAFMQLPAGIFSDRFGPRRLVSVMLLLAALASISFSLSSSFPMMLASRLLVGLSVSCIFVPAIKFIATFFPASMFSTLASILTLANVLGLLAASAPLALLIETVGWRAGFFHIGIATAVLAAAAWAVIAELPAKGKSPAGKPSRPDNPSRQPEAATPGLFDSIKTVCRESGLWPVSIRNHLNYGAIMNFQSIWAGPYLIGIVGVDRVEAGSLIMFLSLGGLVSPFSGYLSDWVFKSRKKPAVLAAFGTVLFWTPFAFFTDRLTPGLIAFLFLFNGVLNGLAMGAGLAMVKELYPNRVAGTAIGLNNLFTMAGPAVIPVIISAAMNSHTLNGVMTADTFAVGFRFSLAAAALAAVAILFSKETFDASIFHKTPGLEWRKTVRGRNAEGRRQKTE